MRLTTLPVLIALLACAACGAAPQASAPTPAATPSPIIVTQVLRETVVVTRVATQLATVVVTATPPPALPTATPLPAAGAWEVVNDTSSFDDSATVILLLDALDEIEGAFETTRPTLVLRCQEGQTEAYVVTDLAPDVEAGNLDGATVRLRFGAEAPETLVLSRSTDDKALFFERPAALIERMARHERLVFSFTPFSASPVETTFDLRGLPEVLPQLRAACP